MTERKPISGSSRDYGATADVVPAVGFADFSPTELYNLIESITENLGTINGGMKSLEKMSSMIGGPKDDLQLREKIHSTRQLVNSSVSATSRDIPRLNVVVKRRDKPQKLQVDRLTDSFQEALRTYSSVQKQLSQRMAANIPKQPRPKMDPTLMEQQAIADDEEAALLYNQQAQARLMEFETNMLLEREASLQPIEADVLDLNHIMRELQEMVNAQAETVDTIDDHVEKGLSDVEQGRRELEEAAKQQQRYRRRMFILILIGIVFVIIFIVWVVKAFR